MFCISCTLIFLNFLKQLIKHLKCVTTSHNMTSNWCARCGYNLKKMDMLPGANQRSQRVFFFLPVKMLIHRLKSFLECMCNHLFWTLTLFSFAPSSVSLALFCECLKRAPLLFSDIFTRETKIPYRSTCCYHRDNRWYGNRHPLMLLSEGKVGFQMSEELMLQWDSAPPGEKKWADILLSGSVCCWCLLLKCLLFFLHLESLHFFCMWISS